MSATSESALVRIIEAVRSKLVADGIVTSQNCQSVLYPEPYLAWGQPFVSVIPGVQQTLEADVEGGGRLLDTIAGLLSVRAYIRNRLDTLNIDSNAILSADAAKGILTLIRRIESSLQTYLPATGDGTSLLNQPMILWSYGDILRPYRHRDVIRGEIRFYIEYIEPLTADCEYQETRP